MKSHYLFIILLTFLLVSCNRKFDPTANESEIIIAASVLETRVGYEGTSVLPSSFVMDVDQSGSKYDYSLVTMTKKYTNEYTSAVKMLWADATHSNTVIKAMTIPYDLTEVDVSSPMKVSVSNEQNIQSNVTASDLLGATSSNGISINKNIVNIAFSHLLSRLDITYEIGPEFQGSSFKIKSIILKNICTAGGFSYLNMDFDSSVALDYGDISMYHNEAEKTAVAIFYPYKPVTNPILSMEVTSSNTQYTLECPLVPNSNNGFIGGKRYKVKVGIVGSTVSQASATIALGWDTDTDNQNFVTE